MIVADIFDFEIEFVVYFIYNFFCYIYIWSYHNE